MISGEKASGVLKIFFKKRREVKLARPSGTGFSCDARQESNWRFKKIFLRGGAPDQAEHDSVVMCGRIVTDVLKIFFKKRCGLKLARPQALGLSCDVRQDSN